MDDNDFSTIIRKYVADSRSVNTHPAKLAVLQKLFEDLFGVSLEELIPGFEKELGSKLWGIRGRADLIFSNVVFEIKVDLKREGKDAEEQLMRYLQVLHEREPERRHVGIATDAIEFIAYAPMIKDEKVIGLNKISSVSIAEAPARESVLWLDSFVFSEPKITPSAMDLRWRFGPDSPTHHITIEGLAALWNEVRDERDVALKSDLWAKNMEIVYGGRPEASAFIEHTYLVTLVKLIVYLRLSGDNTISKDRLVRALTGEYFSSYGITNLIEEDFFAWILHPKIRDRTLKLMSDIARELLRYDLSRIDEDFFKEIYQEIVKRNERHRIGEYYTPEWLVELTLKESIALWNGMRGGTPRVLDPACGSGTFLYNAVRILKEGLLKEGKSPGEVLDFILSGVAGVDINPLAVVIAKANYVLALVELLRLGRRVTIPIYVADSIRTPEASTTIVHTEKVNIESYNFFLGRISNNKEEWKPQVIQIPKSVFSRKEVFGQVLEGYKAAVDAYRARKNKNEALKIFEMGHGAQLSEDEREVLIETLKTILSLMDAGLDSVWVFMLSNIYAPILLSQVKFDMVIGNPPWIAMRYIENKNYQDFLKERALSYNLLDNNQVNLFTHVEMATLFFCISSDLYLNDGGLIAFVMPRSVLTGALHHEKFKYFRKPPNKLLKILDLEDVQPLFNVPSCVLIAAKGGTTSYPVLARKYSGKLDEKNLRLSDAIKQLTAADYMYRPPSIPAGRDRHYYDEVKEGATLVPRSLWFVDFEAHEALGIDVSRPYVKTSEDILRGAKEPWRGVKVEGNVEANFIYATLLGGDIIPFYCSKLRPVILPIETTSRGYRILDVDALRNRGFVHMADWLEKCQTIWRERASERSIRNYPRVISWINYMNKLTGQDPGKRFITLYNGSGTNISSCVIDRQTLPEFRILKASLRPRGFVVDSNSFYYETNNEDEAHYISSILNSNLLNKVIKPLQPRGLYGEREIQRRPFMFNIPEFDNRNPKHLELAQISKECHEKLGFKQFAGKSAASMRSEARAAVAKELERIDELVSDLLNL